MVARIATSEVEDTSYTSKNRRKSGVAGAKARKEILSAERRSEIATKAATARWQKGENKMPNPGATALHALLSEDGRQLQNFKFLAGFEAEQCEDDMCAEAAKVIRSAIDDGMPHSPPTTGKPKRQL